MDKKKNGSQDFVETKQFDVVRSIPIPSIAFPWGVDISAQINVTNPASAIATCPSVVAVMNTASGKSHSKMTMV